MSRFWGQFNTRFGDDLIKIWGHSKAAIICAKVLYILSPGDLVYVPSEGIAHNTIDIQRIYKTISMTGVQFMCIQHQVASPIINKLEFTTSNKMERALTGEMIKDVCIPIQVDRLGNITEIGQQ